MLMSYFPCAELPTDPSTRVPDLILTCVRWKTEQIKPYLLDIAVDKKDLGQALTQVCESPDG